MQADPEVSPQVSPQVSVVIPTRRRPDLLPRAVDAVLDQRTGVPFEVLVVNDDVEPLRCLLPRDGRLRILASSAQGVSAARNVGIRAAAAPVVAFTDDDTIAPPGWLDAIHRALTAAPEAVGVEGPVVYGGPWDPLHEHVPEPEIPGGFCSCNVAYRRDALFAAGLFDQEFARPGAEDVDLGLRVSACGPVVYAPDMVMVHPPRQATTWQLLASGRQIENDWRLHTKHPELGGTPSRFGGVVWRARRYVQFARDPAVTEGSRARAARALALGAGVTAVGVVTACTRPMPR